MGINLDAIGMESEPHESSWDSKDCLLYSLGVGLEQQTQQDLN